MSSVGENDNPRTKEPDYLQDMDDRNNYFPAGAEDTDVNKSYIIDIEDVVIPKDSFHDIGNVIPNSPKTGAYKKLSILTLTEPSDVVTTNEPNLERNIDLTKRREPAAVPPGTILVLHKSVYYKGMPGPFQPSYLREEAVRFRYRDVFHDFGKAIKTMQEGKVSEFHINRKAACDFFGYPVILPEENVAIVVDEFFELVPDGHRSKHDGVGGDRKGGEILNHFQKSALEARNKGGLKLLHPFTEDVNDRILRLHLDLAVVYNQYGNPELAFKECQEVFRNEPENKKAILYAARACTLMGDFEAAGRLLKKGIALIPDCEAYQSEVETLNTRMKEKVAKE